MKDNHNVETRQTRNKKKKLRKGRIFLLFLCTFILVVSAFAVYQYRSGLQLAQGSKEESEASTEEELIEFEGDEKTETISNYLIIGIDTRGEEQSRSASNC